MHRPILLLLMTTLLMTTVTSGPASAETRDRILRAGDSVKLNLTARGNCEAWEPSVSGPSLGKVTVEVGTASAPGWKEWNPDRGPVSAFVSIRGLPTGPHYVVIAQVTQKSATSRVDNCLEQTLNVFAVIKSNRKSVGNVLTYERPDEPKTFMVYVVPLMEFGSGPRPGILATKTFRISTAPRS